MSFLVCTFNDGVLALKLDFSFFRPKRVATPPPKKKKKALGPRPLPPPFPLPPLENLDLLAAPALADAPPLPTPSVIVDDAALGASPDATMLMDDDDIVTKTSSPLESGKTDLMQQRRDVRKALRSG